MDYASSAIGTQQLELTLLHPSENTGDRLLSDVRAIPVAMIESLFRL
jgi:hypothetical protein